MVSPQMISRQKLLEAAARVFAEAGFRGATTRRIAEEAGVNEVTIFRLFGSKSQLMSEAIEGVYPDCYPSLPAEPGDDVEQELTEYCTASLDFMRRIRFMIRKTMAELEEHPEMAPMICDHKTPQFLHLVEYASKVRRPQTASEERDLRTACSMLSASLFADALGREVVPTIYPAPEADAARQYVRVFLKLIDVRQDAPSSGERNGTPSRASRSTSR